MSTRVTGRNVQEIPSVADQGGYRGLTALAFSATTALLPLCTAVLADGARQFGTTATQPVSLWSERITAEVTVSGTIAFNIWASCAATFTGRLKARLYKITAGGSAVETLIGEADDDANMVGTGATLYTFNMTPTSTVLSPEERLILRMYVSPISGSFGSGVCNWWYNEETSGSAGNSWFDLTETVGFRANGTTLFLRRTSVNGIGTFFDLLPVLGGSAFTTGVVNTVASGTLVQWTRTAGGTVLDWITGRVKGPGFMFSVATQLIDNFFFWAKESNASANCRIHLRVFRRKPDGTELLVYTNENTTELGTTIAAKSLGSGTGTAVLAQATPFAEDDRIVARLYITPAGTMASGFTCTVDYDHNSNTNVDGNSSFILLEAPLFKAETDPAYVPVPSGMTMGGVGN